MCFPRILGRTNERPGPVWPRSQRVPEYAIYDIFTGSGFSAWRFLEQKDVDYLHCLVTGDLALTRPLVSIMQDRLMFGRRIAHNDWRN